MKDFKSLFENKEADIRPAVEGEGADDKQYIALMSEYKKMRHREGDAASYLLDQAEKLSETGDVSKNAKIAAAYL